MTKNLKNEYSYTYSIGLDIGGTNSVFGIVDGTGNIIASTSIKTQDYDCAENFVISGSEAIKELIKKADVRNNVTSMGIGAPCGNIYSGCIENSANIKWANGINVPIADMFSKELSIPVIVTNDANAATIGEMTFGAAKGMKDFIVLTLGTGIGSGIVANGQLIYGKDGFAGELGHVIMDRENGRPCGCGRKGCLETYCSATGVVRTARIMLSENHIDSELRKINESDLTSYDIALAANNGDELANEVFSFTGEMLGKACADFATFLSPQAFIFFGGLANAGELLLSHVRRSYKENALAMYQENTDFLVSKLKGADAAILGAAALGFNNSLL